MEDMNERNVVNADNDCLGEFAGFIGHVDEVNGSGALEIPAFVPTRGELLQLVRYWYERILDIQWFWYMYGQTGSMEIRLEPFAHRRISRIADLIGQKAVDEVVEKTTEEFRKGIDAETWRIFTDGTREEREEYADQIDREDYRREMDVLGHFLQECCEEAPNSQVSAMELYQIYQWWCGMNGEKTESNTQFGRAMTTKGVKRGNEKTTRRTLYKDLKVNPSILEEFESYQNEAGTKSERV
jgi:hypothetical protein